MCGFAVALLFCQQRGYAHTNGYDTDRRKVVAETLAGEICTRSKCRVFNYIGCAP